MSEDATDDPDAPAAEIEKPAESLDYRLPDTRQRRTMSVAGFMIGFFGYILISIVWLALVGFDTRNWRRSVIGLVGLTALLFVVALFARGQNRLTGVAFGITAALVIIGGIMLIGFGLLLLVASMCSGPW